MIQANATSTLARGIASLTTLAIASFVAAQWTVTNLDPAGQGGSAAYGGAGANQVGYVRVGGFDHASIWSGTSSSWIDLNPIGQDGSWLVGAYGNTQFGTGTPNGGLRAGLWHGTASSFVNLNPASFSNSQINGGGGGQQVGYVESPGQYAGLWTGTAASFVNLNPGWANSSYGEGGDGIQQVGEVYPGGAPHAVVWSGTAASCVDLSPVSNYWQYYDSYALGVNSGHQVGWAEDRYNHGHAMLWSGTAASYVDLSPSGSGGSEASGVYQGFQVGFASVGGKTDAGYWSGTAASWVDLGALLPNNILESYATGIWGDGSHLYISGYGVDSSYVNRAFMWSRPVPEPGTLAVLGLGLLTVDIRRRRRRSA